jgi:exosortase
MEQDFSAGARHAGSRLGSSGFVARYGPTAIISRGLLVVGFASLLIPTLFEIAKTSWGSEQGSHGPIVLAIACWLFVRTWPSIRARARPGRPLFGALALTFSLILFIAGDIVGSIMFQSLATYLAGLSILYLLVGLAAMRRGWFPLVYFIFVLPPPGSFVATLTQPLRLHIASAAVGILYAMGLPVAREGLLIYVGPYSLEVQAACAGLNSIVSLTAVGLFYAYALYSKNWRYCLVLTFAAFLLAIVANLFRVMTIMLIAYFMGDKAAQGFLHGSAGIVMFVVAVGGLLAFDRIAAPKSTGRRPL